ncbi:MAG TPA: hypothetical protein VF883_03005 [Thermoanaerobaculia bacterium]
MPEVELELESLTPELETNIAAQDYGTALEGKRWTASIADRPMALRLDRVFERLGKPVPATVDLYRGYDVWLVPNRFSMMRRGGFAEPTSIGIECRYLTEGATCSVVGLMPAPQFIVLGGASGDVRCSGAVTASGAIVPDAGFVPDPGEQQFANGMKFSLGASGHIHVRFSVVVVTRLISATGLGSAHVQWHFEKDKEPLDGKDLETWSTVVVPKDMPRLEYEARLFLTMRTAFFPTRMESAWQRITCEFVGS